MKRAGARRSRRPMVSAVRAVLPLLILALVPRLAAATVYTVAASGGDFTVIQDALDTAVAGDTILVHEKLGPYFERLQFPRSGSAGNFITLQAAPGERPIL